MNAKSMPKRVVKKLIDPMKASWRASNEAGGFWSHNAVTPMVRVEGRVIFNLATIPQLERFAMIDALNRGYAFDFGNARWVRYWTLCRVFKVPANGISSYTGNGLEICWIPELMERFKSMHQALWSLIGNDAIARQTRRSEADEYAMKKVLKIDAWQYDNKILQFKRPTGMRKHASARFLEPLLPPRDEAHVRAACIALNKGMTISTEITHHVRKIDTYEEPA